MRDCSAKLKDARQKVEILIEENGGLKEEPFDIEDS